MVLQLLGSQATHSVNDAADLFIAFYMYIQSIDRGWRETEMWEKKEEPPDETERDK